MKINVIRTISKTNLARALAVLPLSLFLVWHEVFVAVWPLIPRAASRMASASVPTPATVAMFAKGPKIALERIQVKVRDLSLKHPPSGWRDIDDQRTKEIKDLCYSGKMAMNVFGGVVVLKGETDTDGKMIIDDGLSSGLAWNQMMDEYEANSALCPTGDVWDPMVIEVFQKGLVVSVGEYPDNDIFYRSAWNAAKHDEQNNKFRQTSVATKLLVVRNCFNRVADYAQVTKVLNGIYGDGMISSVRRWVP